MNAMSSPLEKPPLFLRSVQRQQNQRADEVSLREEIAQQRVHLADLSAKLDRALQLLLSHEKPKV